MVLASDAAQQIGRSRTSAAPKVVRPNHRGETGQGQEPDADILG